MNFSFIMFVLLMFIFVTIVLILSQAKINETNEFIADTKIKTEKELYELRRRVAILEKALESEVEE